MKNLFASVGAFAISLSFLTPATALSPLDNSHIDQYLTEYVDSVDGKKIPLIVDREGKKWFEDNTSAVLKRVHNLPLWGVNPVRTNALAAIEELDDNSILINHKYEVPKLPQSDVSDTDELANPEEIIGADVLHADGYEGAGTSVAILDTGIQASHEYFEDDQGNSRIVAQACFVYATGETEWAKCKNGQDSDLSANAADISHMSQINQSNMDHGTHVAGLAAGNGNSSSPDGVAPEAGIVAVRVFGSEGASDFDIWSALGWVKDNAATYNIKSVNLSLGSGLYSPGDCYSDSDIYWEYWYRLVFQELIDAGVAPLVATGNDGVQNRISSPACIEPAIAIGSSNGYDASLDSYETISYFTNISSQIDLIAPGHNVTSSLPGDQYGLMSGTSMATPVAAGGFALLQSIEQKTVEQWLSILKDTGTPLNGDAVDNISRINLDWAACASLDCLVPPTEINFSANLAQNTKVTWQKSPYGINPTGFEILLGETPYSASSNATQVLVDVVNFSDLIKIRSTSGAQHSDWAVIKPFTFTSLASYKLKTSGADEIVEVQLAGDYCTSEVTPYISYKYESTSTSLRNVWIDGPNGFSTITETRYTPAADESLANDNKTKQLIITDPLSVIDAQSRAFTINNRMYGTGYLLSNLYQEIDGAEYSPSAPTGLVATGGPSRALLNWDNDASSAWKVLVDGQVVAEVQTPNAVVPLTPGEHQVSVCSVKTSGQNVYTSIKSTAVVTALPGIFQEITNPTAPSLNARGKAGVVTAVTTSGLNPTFQSQTADICTVNAASGKVTPLKAGNCIVEVTQTGDGTYAAAEPIDISFEVGQELPAKVRSLKTVINQNKIRITWKAPDNSAEISGYKVLWRSKLKGRTFSSWKTVNLAANKYSFTSKKFSSGTKIEFQVLAVSLIGEGQISTTSRTIK